MKNKILITAYAINPNWGSEQGIGWNFIINISKQFILKVITRSENQTHIEKYIKQNKINTSNIIFYYFDFSSDKKWNHSAVTVMIHYYVWQYFVVSFIKKNRIDFDICHNLNFHNDWTPSFLFKLKKPFIWGPIGHHEKIPSNYCINYSKKQVYSDLIKWSIKKYFWNISPALKATIRKADKILFMNSKSLPNLNRIDDRILYLNAVGSKEYLQNWDYPDALRKYSDTSEFNILCIARFVPLKGIDLALNAISIFLSNICGKANINFYLVGKGECESLYNKLIFSLGIEKNVTIYKWMPHNELDRLYKLAHIFLFPSHEGAGMVVVEAMANGIPIICLDNEGPGEIVCNLCSSKIEKGTFDQTSKKIAEELIGFYSSKEKCIEYSLNAYKYWKDFYTWEKKGKKLSQIYSEFLNEEDCNC